MELCLEPLAEFCLDTLMDCSAEFHLDCSVSILVTPVFGHKKEFIFLNIQKVFGDLFQRFHNSVSLLLQFLCNSKHLKT